MVKKSIGMVKECLKEKTTVLKACLWYIIMLAAIYGFAAIIGMLMPKNSYEIIEFIQNSPSFIVLFSLISIVYIIAVIFIYSFFKIIIIHTVQKKNLKKSSFNILGSFFLFNILIGILAAIVFVLIGSIINYTFSSSKTASIIYVFVFLFFVYPFIKFSQLVFFKELKIFRSMKVGFKTVFSKLGPYIRIMLTNIVYIILFLLVFLIIGSIYKLIFAQKTSMIYITVYNTIFTGVAFLLIIMLASYNIYFFNKIVNKIKD